MTLICEPAVRDLAAVEAFAHRWEIAWNAHDADGVAALCAEGLVYDEPALGGTVYGRDKLRAFVTAMDAQFPDHTFHFQGLFADIARRAVLVAWRFTGTHAETERKVEFHGDDRLEFGEDGLVTAYRCLYDNRLVLRQIGKKPQ
jgi:steroid delta-isomerase-like uncharacterized protein